MNAPLPPDAVAVAELPVAAIVASPSNPRKHIDDAYIAELADSIKSHGLIQPITVRPLPLDALLEYNRHRKAGDDNHPQYQIVVGECRWRAARAAGLDSIPAFWRELDDKQVLEIQVIENLQRRDVHPIEEAEGYEALMKRHGYKADEIAAKIGKSRGYVYARLKLLALGRDAREEFFGGKLEASIALLIARIPPSLQKKALKSVIEGYNGEPLSYRTAKHNLASAFTISLKQATFPLDDAALVATAGSCSACPKRAGNDLVMTAEGIDADVCTDTPCFDDKKATRRLQLIAYAEQRGIKVCDAEAVRKGAIEDLVDLDEAIEGDGQNRSYRDILGDTAPVVALAELGYGQRTRMTEFAEPTALAKALKKAGWQPDLLKAAEKSGGDTTGQTLEQRAAESAERKAREQARDSECERLRKLKDDLLARLAGEGNVTADRLPKLVRIFAAAFFRQQSDYGGIETEWLNRYGYQLPDEYDAAEEVPKIVVAIQQWPLGKLMAFLFEYLVHDDMRPSWDWKPGDDTPPNFVDLAEFLGGNPTQAAQAQDKSANLAETIEGKAKKGDAKKAKAKTDPAPAMPANEPATPVKGGRAGVPWPFPAKATA
jgi:ParB/RepB/Spo0J family partition protein